MSTSNYDPVASRCRLRQENRRSMNAGFFPLQWAGFITADAKSGGNPPHTGGPHMFLHKDFRLLFKPRLRRKSLIKGSSCVTPFFPVSQELERGGLGFLIREFPSVSHISSIELGSHFLL
jgi:hypothetical protein